MRFPAALALLLLCASAAPGQGLTITPNPYDASATAPLVFQNDTAVPVRFDSLTFATALEGSPVGWFVLWSGGTVDDPTYGTLYCPVGYTRAAGLPGAPTCGDSDLLFGRVVAPGARVVFEEVRLTCGLCRGVGGAGRSDTMFVYTAGLAVPQAVPILNGVLVASEPGPEAPGVA